jgi:hypothetical protein
MSDEKWVLVTAAPGENAAIGMHGTDLAHLVNAAVLLDLYAADPSDDTGPLCERLTDQRGAPFDWDGTHYPAGTTQGFLVCFEDYLAHVRLFGAPLSAFHARAAAFVLRRQADVPYFQNLIVNSLAQYEQLKAQAQHNQSLLAGIRGGVH